MTHLKYAWFFAIIGIILFAMFFTDYDIIKLSNKLINVGAILLIGVLFTKFWINRKVNTDDKIYSDPVATAMYNGLWVIAIALAFCIG